MEVKKGVKVGVEKGVKHFVLDDTTAIVQCSMFNVQWSKMRLSESRAKLAWAMPSVSILGEANGQCSMVNVQWSMFNVQWSMFNGQCSMVYSAASFMRSAFSAMMRWSMTSCISPSMKAARL